MYKRQVKDIAVIQIFRDGDVQGLVEGSAAVGFGAQHPEEQFGAAQHQGAEHGVCLLYTSRCV